MWVEGTVDGAPAAVLVDGTAIRATVVLDNGRDASFAWVSDDTVLAVSGGTLLRIDLKIRQRVRALRRRWDVEGSAS